MPSYLHMTVKVAMKQSICVASGADPMGEGFGMALQTAIFSIAMLCGLSHLL